MIRNLFDEWVNAWVEQGSESNVAETQTGKTPNAVLTSHPHAGPHLLVCPPVQGIVKLRAIFFGGGSNQLMGVNF